MTKISADEVADVLRQGLRGKIAIELLGDRSWSDVWCGNIEYAFGDWRITFFNDVMELDYVDRVVAPDGRTIEYDQFDVPEGETLIQDPVDLLSEDERALLESRLVSITAG
ncbi:DUF7693 family protein [Burkholderia arboris]|uniref:DUF7693 family protein n=1 Tax=Burkholderia arboris TaxID=488730 RepID=UPI001CF50F79|nr:hypothetical protein [Burkholderia arboris]MCA8045492.1 hypothetical protein [Burkholderia arboris]